MFLKQLVNIKRLVNLLKILRKGHKFRKNKLRKDKNNRKVINLYNKIKEDQMLQNRKHLHLHLRKYLLKQVLYLLNLCIMLKAMMMMSGQH
jgi:hypothetical protein